MVHIVNNYEVGQLLGEGGMGAVYEATHPVLGRKAAIKVLKPEFSTNRELVQRFINEARAANAIAHPNIIDVIDVGILPEGIPYMMMEYLSGETLAERLSRVKRLSLDEALNVTLQTAAALEAAHAAGIIHRDLKPDNLFLQADPKNPVQEQVKILDFGIAKLRGEPGIATPTTEAGLLIGTPLYMSPEQCMGNLNQIDHRSDIYSLGIILYEMLCGQPPFRGKSSSELLIQHVTAEPASPRQFLPDIPPHIEFTILKALQKDRLDRIQSMDEFQSLLTNRHIGTSLKKSATKAFSDLKRDPNPSAETNKNQQNEFRKWRRIELGVVSVVITLMALGVGSLFKDRLVFEGPIPSNTQSESATKPRTSIENRPAHVPSISSDDLPVLETDAPMPIDNVEEKTGMTNSPEKIKRVKNESVPAPNFQAARHVAQKETVSQWIPHDRNDLSAEETNQNNSNATEEMVPPPLKQPPMLKIIKREKF